jgi:type III restriction enzyme
MTSATASWITRRPHPDGVEACVRDTNINVWGLVERRRHGLDDACILERVQGLTPADLEAAWAYYDRHRDEIEEAIRRNAEA